MNTEPFVQAIKQMPTMLDRELNLFFITALNAIWSMWGKTIIAVLLLAILFIIIQLLIGGTNKMPPIVNRYVGKVFRVFFACLIYAILYLFLGATVIDWQFFVLSLALSYIITKIFLRDMLGFWYY